MYLIEKVCSVPFENLFSNEPYHSCIWSVLLNTQEALDNVRNMKNKIILIQKFIFVQRKKKSI